MNELTEIIVQKTGISPENAQKAVQVVLEFLKRKLPAPIAGQLDSFLAEQTGGGNPLAEQVGDLLKGKLGAALGSAV